MKEYEDVLKSPRLIIENSGNGYLAAHLAHPAYKPHEVAIIAGWNERAKDGSVTEHVSVSLRKRCPTWDEMCIVKDIFWEDEEMVIQLHPPKSQYVNMHPYCLHLWRKQGWEPDMEW